MAICRAGVCGQMPASRGRAQSPCRRPQSTNDAQKLGKMCKNWVRVHVLGQGWGAPYCSELLPISKARWEPFGEKQDAPSCYMEGGWVLGGCQHSGFGAVLVSPAEAEGKQDA